MSLKKKKFGSKIFVFFRPFVQASKRVWEIELFALSNCKVTTWINIKETRFKAKTRLCPIKFEVKRKLQTHLGDDFVGSFILWRIQTFMITLLFLSKDDSIFSEKGTIPELACKWLTIGHTFAYERGRTPSIYRSSWERSVIRTQATVAKVHLCMGLIASFFVIPWLLSYWHIIGTIYINWLQNLILS